MRIKQKIYTLEHPDKVKLVDDTPMDESFKRSLETNICLNEALSISSNIVRYPDK